MSANAANIGAMDIPLDVVRRIADIFALSGYGKNIRAVRQDIKRFCLVNRLFAEAFQPFVFDWTVMSNAAAQPRLQKQLDLLISSPRIRVYVTRLTLTMQDGAGDEALLCSILDGGFLTNVKALTIMASSWTSRWAKWSSFSQPFRSAIERFCSESQNLQHLSLHRLDGVPTSVFANPGSAITSVYLCASRPAFDFSKPCEHPSTTTLSLNLVAVDLSNLDLGSIIGRGRGFFSRLRSLKGSTSWQPDKNAAFDKFLSLVGSVSRLEVLEVSSPSSHNISFNGPYPQQLIGCLPELKHLKRLALSTNDASLRTHFISSLPIVLESLDAAPLECFSIGIYDVKHADLPVICIPNTVTKQTPVSAGWSALNTAFCGRQEQGKLGRLKEVKITIRLGVIAAVMNLEDSRKLVREAVFLPQFPPEKLLVRLQLISGEPVYDSQNPALR